MGCPLVSIIIPIYNVSDYVDTCIESACRQTYKNLEIILVDDGSPDDCPQKCDAWAIKDNRIKVIHKKNGGLSDARNAGLDIATGKYIYFLDGDDSIKNNLVETIVKHMEDGADMVVFCHQMVIDAENVKKGQSHEEGVFLVGDEQKRCEFIIQKLLSEKLGWEAWNRVYSRSKIEKYNLRFVDNQKIFAEDLYFCLCYCAHAEKIVSVADVLYNYMLRPNSIMDSQKTNLNIDRMNELSKSVYSFLEQYPDCFDIVKNFAAIHFLIINNAMQKALRLVGNKDIFEQRKIILKDISDIEFFTRQINSLLKRYKLIEKCYPGIYLAETLSFYRYLLKGSIWGLRIRNRFLYKFKDLIECNFGCNKERIKQVRKLLYSKDTVIVIGTEDFGNIGDHQIAVSMIDFLKESLQTDKILEISASKFFSEIEIATPYIKKYHTIVMPGGGNFGNIYSFAQNIREYIVSNFADNKKIVFPQTVHYTDDIAGNESLEKAKQIFVKGNNITLFVRDDFSYKFAKDQFSCDGYFAPDIVLSKGFGCSTEKENRVLLCLRSDLESNISSETHSFIENLINKNNLVVDKFDTQKDYNISVEDRARVTEDTLELWQKSRLVITDRLHGMIFAAITGTPCVALNNFNHKVSGTYEYIKYLPYIRLAQTTEEIEKAFNELVELEKCNYDVTPLLPYYEKLKEVLKEK